MVMMRESHVSPHKEYNLIIYHFIITSYEQEVRSSQTFPLSPVSVTGCGSQQHEI